MVVFQNEIEDKLFSLQVACNRYKETDCLADWVLWAIHRYIYSGRVTRQFEHDFVNFPDECLENLIKECLNGDRSDDGILKTVRKIIGRKINEKI